MIKASFFHLRVVGLQHFKFRIYKHKSTRKILQHQEFSDLGWEGNHHQNIPELFFIVKYGTFCLLNLFMPFLHFLFHLTSVISIEVIVPENMIQDRENVIKAQFMENKERQIVWTLSISYLFMIHPQKHSTNWSNPQVIYSKRIIVSCCSTQFSEAKCIYMFIMVIVSQTTTTFYQQVMKFLS